MKRSFQHNLMIAQYQALLKVQVTREEMKQQQRKKKIKTKTQTVQRQIIQTTPTEWMDKWKKKN